MKEQRAAIALTGLLALLWALSAEFAAAFQCRLPRAWAVVEGQCFNQVGPFCYFVWFDADSTTLELILDIFRCCERDYRLDFGRNTHIHRWKTAYGSQTEDSYHRKLCLPTTVRHIVFLAVNNEFKATELNGS